MRYSLISGLAALVSGMPIAVFAHAGPEAHVGLVQGFAHPLAGPDHVLAMVAVGVLAAASGGRAVWSLPAVFVGAMVAGALLGWSGAGLPLVEQGIAVSVVVLGGAVAAGLRLPTALVTGLVAVFGLFHGHAHGSEGAGATAFLPYAAGFIGATVLLHLAGLGLGRSIDRLGAAPAMHLRRLFGAVGAVAGLAMIAG